MIPPRRFALVSSSLLAAACVALVATSARAQGSPPPRTELVVPPPSVWTAPPATSVATPAPATPARTTVEGPARVPVAWQMASEAPPMPTTMVKDTYPGHVLIADGLSFGALILGIHEDSAPLVSAGIVGYFAGGPLVHVAHGRAATGGASVGLRVLTPLVGALAFAGIVTLAAGGDAGGDCGGDFCIEPAAAGAALGGVLGVIAAPILDASLLARKEWFNYLPLVPAVAINPGGGTVTLGGVF
jgi:hypothetical protein